MSPKIQSVEATIQPDGSVRLKRRLRLKSPAKAMLTVMVEPAPNEPDLTSAQISQPSLAKDWLCEEEDKAWAHLQPEA